MTAMPVKTLMTAEEFLALPYTEELRHAELVDGELVVSTPGFPHDIAQKNLQYALETWSRSAQGRGRVHSLDVGIDERNVYEPDIAWYSEARKPGPDDPRPWGVPDLAAEVRSPSTWRYDIGAKKSGYERRGLPELWLVDTAADEVLVFRRSKPGGPTFDLAGQHGRGEVLGSPLLAGFELALDELFSHDQTGD